MKKNNAILLILFTTTHICALQLGVERLSPATIQKYNLNTKRVGLITNQTGKTQNGTTSVDALRAKNVNITLLFVPEHGYTGTVPAGQSVDNSVDPATQLPIVSLYSHKQGLVGRTINADMLNTVDTLIFDMQDSGMRHYTYISTLLRCLQAAQEHNKQIIVLDRPNPLGGAMEGPLVEPELISFISIAPIPLRHGMTIGELAWYFNRHMLKKPSDLHVVTMRDYNRSNTAHDAVCTPLSPNLPTTHACYGYSFLGLLGEVKPFDVGVGTNDAFQCIMLPQKTVGTHAVWRKAQALLADHGIHSKPHTRFCTRKKQKLEGLRLSIDNIGHVKSFPLFLSLVQLFKNHGVSVDFAPTFDKAIGTQHIRNALSSNATLAHLCTHYRDALQTFHTQARPAFLYTPHPVIH